VLRTAKASFVLDALEQAIHARRPGMDGGLIDHSERGSQCGLNRSSQHPDAGGCDDEEEQRSARSLRKALRSPGRRRVA
jgi:hypothetical protein